MQKNGNAYLSPWFLNNDPVALISMVPGQWRNRLYAMLGIYESTVNAYDRRFRLVACAGLLPLMRFFNDEVRQIRNLSDSYADGEVEYSLLRQHRDEYARKYYSAAGWTWIYSEKTFNLDGVGEPLFDGETIILRLGDRFVFPRIRSILQGYLKIATWFGSIPSIDIDVVEYAHLLSNIIRDIIPPPGLAISLNGYSADDLSTARNEAISIYAADSFDKVSALWPMLNRGLVRNEHLMRHCSGLVSHYKGCWLVDLLLNKGSSGFTVGENLG